MAGWEGGHERGQVTTRLTVRYDVPPAIVPLEQCDQDGHKVTGVQWVLGLQAAHNKG